MPFPVSSRSMYDMQELRSIVQNMHRDPFLLTGGWKEYLYFLEEYFPTMNNNPWKLMSFLVEDCARCPLGILVAVTDILKKVRKSVTMEDYRRVSTAIARQPMDRSVVYLSVACLEQVRPISEDLGSLMTRGVEKWVGPFCPRPDNWHHYLWHEKDEATKLSFLKCMAFIQREVWDVDWEYPMTSDTVLRLSAAISHLVAWDAMHPKVRIAKESVKQTIARTFIGRATNFSGKRVRPLIFAFVAATNWMNLARETLDKRADQFVTQYLNIALAYCADESASLDRLAMNALLVLMGRFPDESVPDFLSEDPPCDSKDVPSVPRAFPMPKVSQDRDTRRGKNLTDTAHTLKKHCEKLGLQIPDNIEYSHGPPAHETKQGFEEFMEHIQACEYQMGDGNPPVFKEKALSIYRSLPQGVKDTRMEILKQRLPDFFSERKARAASKSKQEEDASHLEK